LVDLTVEEGQRLKVIYGSCSGFHAVDVDSGAVYDIYLPTHVSSTRTRTNTHTHTHTHTHTLRKHDILSFRNNVDCCTFCETMANRTQFL